MLVWIHGLQPPTVNGSLCTDLGRLWTAVGREVGFVSRMLHKLHPSPVPPELTSWSHSPQVLVPLQVGGRFPMYILPSLCDPCLVVMLYEQSSSTREVTS